MNRKSDPGHSSSDVDSSESDSEPRRRGDLSRSVLPTSGRNTIHSGEVMKPIGVQKSEACTLVAGCDPIEYYCGPGIYGTMGEIYSSQRNKMDIVRDDWATVGLVTAVCH